MEKLKIPYAVVVEGKYDKIKLSSIIDTAIIVTNGFGVYKNSETVRLIRYYAEKTGIIILTDSDTARVQNKKSYKKYYTKRKDYKSLCPGDFR